MTELQEDGQVFGHAVRIDTRPGEGLGDLEGSEPRPAAVGRTLELFHLAEEVAERTLQSAQDRVPLHRGGRRVDANHR